MVKEVKLMAQNKGIRMNQYLDWLLRAPCPETCQQHTQTLLALCRDLAWVVNIQKSELIPQQDFSFVGYQFDQSGVANSRKMGEFPTKVPVSQESGQLLSPAVHALDRATDSHRKASLVRSPPHETHTVASEMTLARRTLQLFTDTSNEGWAHT